MNGKTNTNADTNANTNAQQQIQIQSYKYVDHRSSVPSQLVAKCCLLFQVHAGHADTCDKYVHKHKNTQIHMDRHTSAKTDIKAHIQRYKCNDRFVFFVKDFLKIVKVLCHAPSAMLEVGRYISRRKSPHTYVFRNFLL